MKPGDCRGLNMLILVEFAFLCFNSWLISVLASVDNILSCQIHCGRGIK